MTYQVTFTESTNPSKPPITVADSTLNNQTSLTFVGQKYTGFAPILANDFLHLLENFANSIAPVNPVEGQLWFDSNTKLLKVFDGTTWAPAGSLKKASTAPLVANSSAGDLWVDTTNSQLYLFSGANWLLVGPQFSAGTLTGPTVESIIDTGNVTHNVITMYANNSRMAIVSKETFTPKATLTGFVTINEGMNLSTVNSTSTTSPSRFWGTASAADALLINNVSVPSANFLRSDQSSVTNYPLSVRSDGGLSVGSNLSFNIGINGNSTVLYSNGSGNSIDFTLNNAGTANTVVHIGAAGRVGIGSNNTSPASTLDVAGLITASTGLNITGTTESTSIGTGTIITAGGLSVAKNTSIGGNLSTFGQILVNNLNGNGDPVASAVILPGSDAATITYDIGTSARQFRNIYAQTFVGNFNGNFTGSLTGSISGKAAALISPTVFSLTGDVTSNAVSFDGQSPLGTAIFTTSINSNLITSKTAVTDSQQTDELLIFRPGTGANSGLFSMTKQTLMNHVATVPVGSMMPYAGSTAPAGYVFCDGSEVRISEYPLLYGIIGYTYKAVSLLQGLSTFALPDMRGRFPLGRDNMNNGFSVPSKDGSGTLITTSGGSADRVTDITADTMGTGSGSQSVSLSVNNLPDHKHNLNSGNAQYYAGGLPGAGTDPNAVPGLGLPTSSTGSGLPNSGSIVSNTLGTAVNVMNPYATINYIIFTGTL